jgi:uncharacterized protein (TIGR04255 family)
MSEEVMWFPFPPIVEAVVDIECDLPPNFNLIAIEASANTAFQAEYPQSKKRFVEQHVFEPHGEEPATHTTMRGIQALQFQKQDNTQLVQVRTTGYSFNRLAPYSTLDDYLPAIEKTWTQFVKIASPVQIRAVKLRYINRILIPLMDGKLDLDGFLTVGPQLPDESNLTFVGFLNQYAAVESSTKAKANVVLTIQPTEGDKLPLIFDIGVEQEGVGAVEDWPWVRDKILSLRGLKNRIFKNTLTDQCRNLFQSGT